MDNDDDDDDDDNLFVCLSDSSRHIKHHYPALEAFPCVKILKTTISAMHLS